VDPKKRPQPAVREEAEKEPGPLDTLKSWAREKREAETERLALPPEKCPWCGQDMEQGFLSGGRGVFWTRGVPDTKNKWLGGTAQQVDDEGFFYTYKTAWRCMNCQKMVVDTTGMGGEDANSTVDSPPDTDTGEETPDK
jgi:hypothetical protein